MAGPVQVFPFGGGAPQPLDTGDSPTFEQLTVRGPNAPAGVNVFRDNQVGIELESYRASAGTHGYFNARSARGTEASPAGLDTGDRIYQFQATPHNGSSFDNTAAAQSRLDAIWDGAAVGWVLGSATGGAQGAGTLNAKGLYDDGSLTADVVREAVETGQVDTNKWDAFVPDHVFPEEHILEPDDSGGVRTVVIPAQTQVRQHSAAHMLKAMMDEGLNPSDYRSVRDWLYNKRTVPGMPDLQEWSERKGKISLGELDTRNRIATEILCECMCQALDSLEGRVAALEGGA